MEPMILSWGVNEPQPDLSLEENRALAEEHAACFRRAFNYASRTQMVYVLTSGTYEESGVDGVCSTLEDAMAGSDEWRQVRPGVWDNGADGQDLIVIQEFPLVGS